MSTQNEFNTKAIELTHDELKDIVGGAAKAGPINSSLTAVFEAQTAATNEAALQAAKAESLSAQLKGQKKAADAYKALLQ